MYGAVSSTLRTVGILNEKWKNGLLNGFDAPVSGSTSYFTMVSFRGTPIERWSVNSK